MDGRNDRLTTEPAAGDVRERILDAFLELVIASGVDKATYRAVAELAGVSLGAVQHYFPEKAQLVGEALHYAHRRYRDATNRAGPLIEADGSNGEVKQEILSGLPFTQFAEHSWPFYVQYWAYANRDAEVRRVHVQRWEEGTAEVRASVAEALARAHRVADERDADDIASALVALMFGLGVNHTLRPERYTAARIRRIVDRTVDALLAPPQPPTAK